jgi:hypothetical protein
VAEQIRDPELQLEDDPALEERLKLARKIGWTIFTLILIAALLGLLGRGPLSEKRVGDASAYVEFQRFDHYEAPTRLLIGFDEEPARSDKLRVAIERRYLKNVLIDEITPHPFSTESTEDAVVFIFALAGDRPKGEIWLDLKGTTFGWSKGQVTIGSAKPLAVEQFFFP